MSDEEYSSYEEESGSEYEESEDELDQNVHAAMVEKTHETAVV